MQIITTIIKPLSLSLLPSDIGNGFIPWILMKHRYSGSRNLLCHAWPCTCVAHQQSPQQGQRARSVLTGTDLVVVPFQVCNSHSIDSPLALGDCVTLCLILMSLSSSIRVKSNLAHSLRMAANHFGSSACSFRQKSRRFCHLVICSFQIQVG